MVQWSSLISNKSVIGVVAATTAVVVVVGAAYVVRKHKEKQFELVGRVSALNCFPIKSCAGLTNDVAFCTAAGLRMSNAMDRHFVIVRPNGDFITQRQFSRMAGIKTSCEGQDLVLNAEGMPQIKVPLYPKLDRKKVVPCRVWKSHMEAQDCGAEVASWISEFLKEDLRLLVLVQGLKFRDSTPAKSLSKDKIAFPDESAYLIATEQSLADLQSRIKESPDGSVTMNNFRPNIVIQGTTKPWDEDNWLVMKIGNKLIIRILAPCDRCVLTTVNPATFERRSDEEPLKTLKSFRIFPEFSASPLFGMFAAVEVEHTIHVNDPVYVIRK